MQQQLPSDLRHMLVSRIKKILLSEMTNLRTDFARDFQMVIDDQPHARPLRDGMNRLRHAPHFVARRILGAKLDEVRAAIAQLLRNERGIASVQVGGIHERVESAIVKRFHKADRFGGRCAGDNSNSMAKVVGQASCLSIDAHGCKPAHTKSPTAHRTGGTPVPLPMGATGNSDFAFSKYGAAAFKSSSMRCTHASPQKRLQLVWARSMRQRGLFEGAVESGLAELRVLRLCFGRVQVGAEVVEALERVLLRL